MPKRHDNTIYKLFLGIKKTIKAILSSTTRIRPIIYMEDPKEAFSVDHIYIEEDTKVEETTIVDIITTTHPVRSDAIFITNLDINQVSI
jgi:phage terminase large subunit GpA-like protein